MVNDEGSVPTYDLQRDQSFYILFAVTAAGVVPCGGPKKPPCTLNMVQIILFCSPLRSVRIFRV